MVKTPALFYFTSALFPYYRVTKDYNIEMILVLCSIANSFLLEASLPIAYLFIYFTDTTIGDLCYQWYLGGLTILLSELI